MSGSSESLPFVFPYFPFVLLCFWRFCPSTIPERQLTVDSPGHQIQILWAGKPSSQSVGISQPHNRLSFSRKLPNSNQQIQQSIALKCTKVSLQMNGSNYGFKDLLIFTAKNNSHVSLSLRFLESPLLFLWMTGSFPVGLRLRLRCVFWLELPEHRLVSGIQPAGLPKVFVQTESVRQRKSTRCWHGNCGFMKEGVIWHAKQTSLFLLLWNTDGRFLHMVPVLNRHWPIKDLIQGDVFDFSLINPVLMMRNWM